MNTLVLATTVTGGWKVIAGVIAVGILVLLWVISALFSKASAQHGRWNPWRLVEGADGAASTSKFQWWLWLIIILFAYVFLWVIRAREGHYEAITDVPRNLLTVLGLSTLTAVGAKGITVGYKNAGNIAKTDAATAPAGTTPSGGVVQDDSGAPELAKIQMVGFTLVAVLIFLADVLHQSRGAVPSAQLPNIDSSLLVLMGISQGGYIGKKLVTIASPFIDKIDPKEILVGGSVTITGGGFGVGTGSSRLTLDSNPIATDTWADTQITFTVPTEYPSTGPEPWGTFPRVVRLGVDLGGGTTGNEVSLTVTGPAGTP